MWPVQQMTDYKQDDQWGDDQSLVMAITNIAISSSAIGSSAIGSSAISCNGDQQ